MAGENGIFSEITALQSAWTCFVDAGRACVERRMQKNVEVEAEVKVEIVVEAERVEVEVGVRVEIIIEIVIEVVIEVRVGVDSSSNSKCRRPQKTGRNLRLSPGDRVESHSFV
jgi:hypothetical protein